MRGLLRQRRAGSGDEGARGAGGGSFPRSNSANRLHYADDNGESDDFDVAGTDSSVRRRIDIPSDLAAYNSQQCFGRRLVQS